MSEHKPFVAPQTTMRELSIRAVVIGALLGLLFAASSVYLGLKVGLTVSASIPVAVLSITVFRWLGLKSTILENNIAQTTGSAGESIAAGVAFTLPSLLLMGFDLELMRIMLVALFGGLIGVLMMIPLRQGLIVKEHGKLSYPEGTACAEVLIAGEKGGAQATMVFTGFFVGLGYGLLNLVTRLWHDVAAFAIKAGGLKKAMLGVDVSPPMLGVGYIIGPKVSATMLGGGMLAFVVFIPLIAAFGGEAVAGMSPGAIRNEYILYIGAGAVATGGFIALARAIPTIAAAFRAGLKNLGGGAGNVEILRTERDLPLTFVLGGAGAIAVAIWIAPMLGINFLTSLLVVLFGFFFVTVSSRITGEIGSSSNPISGMTIATLLLTCGLFVILGWVGVGYKAMALTTAALVCVAASNGGTISQDLKTGFLVGATPRNQQISIFVGVISSAIVIGLTLLLLNNAFTTYPAVEYPGVKLASSGQHAAGPDGKTYSIAYAAEQVPVASGAEASMPRGKYLIDEQGAPQFRADPGVSGSYPWTLVAATGKVPAETAAAAKEVDRGPDHRMYKVVTVDGRRLLAADDGTVAYEAKKGDKLDAPKAQLFRLIIDGTLGGELPWHLVLIGVFIAIILELVGVSSLPFAVGLYLPIYTSGGIFVGGAVRWLVDRKRASSAADAESSPGMLMASGLIAGGAIAGVVSAALTAAKIDGVFDISMIVPSFLHGSADFQWLPILPFLAMAGALYCIGVRAKAPELPVARTRTDEKKAAD